MLMNTIRACYDRLVIAGWLRPPRDSRQDSLQVLDELGLATVHHNALSHAHDRQYCDRTAQTCFDSSLVTTGLSLLLYDAHYSLTGGTESSIQHRS